MRCQHCNQNEATTFIKRNINGHKEELHLCSECAKELGVMDEFRMPTMSEMFGDTFLGRCRSCGSSFNDIVQSGRMGCADCYDKFEEKLEPSIRKIHGKTKHIGKFVSYSEDNEVNDRAKEESVSQEKSELESLQEQMKAAINEQRFEDAAVIRDKIKEIQEGKNE